MTDPDDATLAAYQSRAQEYLRGFANAVLLHLSRDQFADLLRRARTAIAHGGVLAFTLKEGDGEAWSEHKLGLPRHFTYWREPAVRSALHRAGWPDASIAHVAGRENWLHVLARHRRSGAAPHSTRDEML